MSYLLAMTTGVTIDPTTMGYITSQFARKSLLKSTLFVRSQSFFSSLRLYQPKAFCCIHRKRKYCNNSSCGIYSALSFWASASLNDTPSILVVLESAVASTLVAQMEVEKDEEKFRPVQASCSSSSRESFPAWGGCSVWPRLPLRDCMHRLFHFNDLEIYDIHDSIGNCSQNRCCAQQTLRTKQSEYLQHSISVQGKLLCLPPDRGL